MQSLGTVVQMWWNSSKTNIPFELDETTEESEQTANSFLSACGALLMSQYGTHLYAYTVQMTSNLFGA